jgi:RNA polymerase sigma factor (sigma-70 family)
MTQTTRESVSQLALMVAQGDSDSFRELERIASPLLVSLSKKFSNYHYKFEFDDFYSIALYSLYKACLEYDSRNPSFLDYAKSFIVRDFCREIQYWNADMRDIFKNKELSCEQSTDDGATWSIIDDIACIREDDSLTESVIKLEARENIKEIINSIFRKDKASIMMRYIFGDHRICDIANEMGINYKNAYSTIRRGMERISKEYERRHL